MELLLFYGRRQGRLDSETNEIGKKHEFTANKTSVSGDTASITCVCVCVYIEKGISYICLEETVVYTVRRVVRSFVSTG